MGNHTSINNTETCLVCWDPVDSVELVRCYRCNITLHAYCEETYRGGKGFCKCPHCQQVGTLGVGLCVLENRTKK